MWMGIPFAIAGSIVLGWSTLAPKNESSYASWKLRVVILSGLSMILGSAVSTPSTSVQI